MSSLARVEAVIFNGEDRKGTPNSIMIRCLKLGSYPSTSLHVDIQFFHTPTILLSYQAIVS
jgi:hypothetical protein